MTKKNESIPEFDPDDYPDYDPRQDELFAPLFNNQGNLQDFWQEPDFLLADIVQALVNIAELEIGITLFVKGMTLTGTLTSEHAYLRDLSETFRNRIQISSQHIPEAEQAALHQMFDFTRLAESPIAQELDDEIPAGMATVRFLHLKNPIIVGQSGVMDFGQNEAPYIRLRLSLIDGWMLGEVVTPEMFHDKDDSDEILH